MQGLKDWSFWIQGLCPKKLEVQSSRRDAGLQPTGWWTGAGGCRRRSAGLVSCSHWAGGVSVGGLDLVPAMCGPEPVGWLAAVGLGWATVQGLVGQGVVFDGPGGWT